jgi:hypothetical protein
MRVDWAATSRKATYGGTDVEVVILLVVEDELMEPVQNGRHIGPQGAV